MRGIPFQTTPAHPLGPVAPNLAPIHPEDIREPKAAQDGAEKARLATIRHQLEQNTAEVSRLSLLRNGGYLGAISAAAQRANIQDPAVLTNLLISTDLNSSSAGGEDNFGATLSWYQTAAQLPNLFEPGEQPIPGGQLLASDIANAEACRRQLEPIPHNPSGDRQRQQLATQLTERIRGLPRGESFLMPGGYLNERGGVQRMFYRFTKNRDDDNYTVCIYNAAAVKGQATLVSSEKAQVFPFMLFENVPGDQLLSGGLPAELIKHLVELQTKSPEDPSKPYKPDCVEGAFGRIADYWHGGHEERSVDLFMRGQRSDFSSHKALNAVALQIFGNKGALKRLTLNARIALLAFYFQQNQATLARPDAADRRELLKEAATNLLAVLDTNYQRWTRPGTPEALDPDHRAALDLAYQKAVATVIDISTAVKTAEDTAKQQLQRQPPDNLDPRPANHPRVAQERAQWLRGQGPSAPLRADQLTPMPPVDFNLGQNVNWSNVGQVVDGLERVVGWWYSNLHAWEQDRSWRKDPSPPGQREQIIAFTESVVARLTDLLAKGPPPPGTAFPSNLPQMLGQLFEQYNEAIYQQEQEKRVPHNSLRSQNTAMAMLALGYRALASRDPNLQQRGIYYEHCRRFGSVTCSGSEDRDCLAQHQKLLGVFQAINADKTEIFGDLVDGTQRQQWDRATSWGCEEMKKLIIRSFETFHAGSRHYAAPSHLDRSGYMPPFSYRDGLVVGDYCYWRTTDTPEGYPRPGALFLTHTSEHKRPEGEAAQQIAANADVHKQDQLQPGNTLAVSAAEEMQAGRDFSLRTAALATGLSSEPVSATAMIDTLSADLEQLNTLELRRNCSLSFYKTFSKDGVTYSPFLEAAHNDPLFPQRLNALTKKAFQHFAPDPAEPPRIPELLFVLRLRANALYARRDLPPDETTLNETVQCVIRLKQIIARSEELKLSQETLIDLSTAWLGLLQTLPLPADPQARTEMMVDMFEANNRLVYGSQAGEDRAFYREVRSRFHQQANLWQRALSDLTSAQVFAVALIRRRHPEIPPADIRLPPPPGLPLRVTADRALWTIDPLWGDFKKGAADVTFSNVPQAGQLPDGFQRLFGDPAQYFFKKSGVDFSFNHPRWGEVIVGPTSIKTTIAGRTYTYIPPRNYEDVAGAHLPPALTETNEVWLSADRGHAIICSGFTGQPLFMVRTDNGEIEKLNFDPRTKEVTLTGQTVFVGDDQQPCHQAFSRFDSRFRSLPVDGQLRIEFPLYVDHGESLHFDLDDQGRWVYSRDPSYVLDTHRPLDILDGLPRYLSLVHKEGGPRKIIIPDGSLSSPTKFSRSCEIGLPVHQPTDGQKEPPTPQLFHTYEIGPDDKLVPTDIDSRLYLANIYLAQKRYAEAWDVLLPISESAVVSDQTLRLVNSLLDLSNATHFLHGSSGNALAIRLRVYQLFQAKLITANLAKTDPREKRAAEQSRLQQLETLYANYLQSRNHVARQFLLSSTDELLLIRSLGNPPRFAERARALRGEVPEPAQVRPRKAPELKWPDYIASGTRDITSKYANDHYLFETIKQGAYPNFWETYELFRANPATLDPAAIARRQKAARDICLAPPPSRKKELMALSPEVRRQRPSIVEEIRKAESLDNGETVARQLLYLVFRNNELPGAPLNFPEAPTITPETLQEYLEGNTPEEARQQCQDGLNRSFWENLGQLMRRGGGRQRFAPGAPAAAAGPAAMAAGQPQPEAGPPPIPVPNPVIPREAPAVPQGLASWQTYGQGVPADALIWDREYDNLVHQFVDTSHRTPPPARREVRTPEQTQQAMDAAVAFWQIKPEDAAKLSPAAKMRLHEAAEDMEYARWQGTQRPLLYANANPAELQQELERIIPQLGQRATDLKDFISGLAQLSLAPTPLALAQDRGRELAREEIDPDFEAILMAACSGPEALMKFNRTLTRADAEQLRLACLEYMQVVTHQRQLERVQKPLQEFLAAGAAADPQLLANALEELNRRRTYHPEQGDVFPLLFEYRAKIRMREDQAAIIKLVLEGITADTPNLQSRMFELVMGGGKTSVIISILAEIAAERGQTPVVLCDPGQLTSVRGNLYGYQSRRFGKDICYIECSVADMRDPAALKAKVYDRLLDARDKKNPIVMADCLPQFFQLEYINLLAEGADPAAIEQLRQVCLFFETLPGPDGQPIPEGQPAQKPLIFRDEVHRTLSLMRDANIPVGEEQQLRLAEVNILGNIYQLIATDPEIAPLVGLRQNAQANMSDEERQRIMRPALAHRLANYPPFGLPDRYKASFERYLRGDVDPGLEAAIKANAATPEAQIPLPRTANPEDVAFLTWLHVELVRSDDVGKRTQARLLTYASGMLGTVLPTALARTGRRGYGNHEGKDDGTVVPFVAGVETNRRFGDTNVSLAYYMQTAIHNGITAGELRFLAKRMARAAHSAIVIDRLSADREQDTSLLASAFDQTSEAQQFLAMTGVPLRQFYNNGQFDKALLRTALENLNEDKIREERGQPPLQLGSARDVWILQRRIAVKMEVARLHIRRHASRLCSNAINAAEHEGPTVACSGTVGAPATYHSKFATSEKERGVEGLVLTTALDRAEAAGDAPGASPYIHVVDSEDLPSLTRLIGAHPEKGQRLRCLIDPAGFLRDHGNAEVSTEVLKLFNDGTVDALIYLHKFTPEEQAAGQPAEKFVIRRRGVDRPILLDSTDEADVRRLFADKQKRFVFFDEARTVGTDIELAPTSLGLVTVNCRTTAPAMEQALIRMRQYLRPGSAEKGQDCEYVTTAKNQAGMIGGGLTVRDLWSTMLRNDGDDVANLKYRSYLMKIDNAVRQRVVRLLLHQPPAISQRLVELYRPFLFTDQSDDAYRLFGNLPRKMPPAALIAQIAAAKIQAAGPAVDDPALQALVGQIAAGAAEEIGALSESAQHDPGLPALVDTTLQLGLEAEVEMEEVEEVETELQTQNQREMEQEMQREMTEMDANTGERFTPQPHIPWQYLPTAGQPLSLQALSSGSPQQRISSVADVCATPRTLGPARLSRMAEKYAQCFAPNIGMTDNFRSTVAQGELPLFHKISNAKKVNFVLVVNEGTPAQPQYKFVFLTNEDAAQMRACNPPNAWVVNLDGLVEGGNRNPVPPKEALAQGLWFAHFFNGDVEHLLANSALSRSIMGASPERKKLFGDFLLWRTRPLTPPAPEQQPPQPAAAPPPAAAGQPPAPQAPKYPTRQELVLQSDLFATSKQAREKSTVVEFSWRQAQRDIAEGIDPATLDPLYAALHQPLEAKPPAEIEAAIAPPRPAIPQRPQPVGPGREARRGAPRAPTPPPVSGGQRPPQVQPGGAPAPIAGAIPARPAPVPPAPPVLQQPPSQPQKPTLPADSPIRKIAAGSYYASWLWCFLLLPLLWIPFINLARSRAADQALTAFTQTNPAVTGTANWSRMSRKEKCQACMRMAA